MSKPVQVPSMTGEEFVEQMRREQEADERMLATLSPEQRAAEMKRRAQEYADALKLAESLGLKIL